MAAKLKNYNKKPVGDYDISIPEEDLEEMSVSKKLFYNKNQFIFNINF